MKHLILATMLALFAVPVAAQPAGDTAREQRNKELMRKFFDEVWQKGNLDFADQVFADSYVRNDPRGGNPPGGPRGQQLIARSFRTQFPDLKYDVHFLVADGDYVVARWTITGTNTGPAPNGGPATGKKIEFVGVNIFRFGPDGKVVEIWNHRDDLGFGLQMGTVVQAKQ